MSGNGVVNVQTKTVGILVRDLFLTAASLILSIVMVCIGFGIACGLGVRAFRWIVGL